MEVFSTADRGIMFPFICNVLNTGMKKYSRPGTGNEEILKAWDRDLSDVVEIAPF